MGAKITVEDIVKSLPSHLSLVKESFFGRNDFATFIDSDFGEFRGRAWRVMTLRSQHPKRSLAQRKKTNLEIYGHENPMGDPNIKQKVMDKLRSPPDVVMGKLPEHISLDVSTYRNVHTKARFIDTRDGSDFWKRPSDLFRSKITLKEGRHIQRYGRRLSLDEIKKRIPPELTLDESTYDGTHKKAKFIHKDYGEWWITPNNLFTHSPQHPKIRMKRIFETKKKNGNFQSSAQEEEIKKFIISLGFTDTSSMFINHKNKSYEIDIKPRESRIGVEYHGLFWHSEKYRSPSYHKNKYDAANHNNIRLIQIFGHEWDQRRAQVCSFLKSAYGKNHIKIGARETVVKEISKDIAVEFLEKYHIQGPGKFKFAFGLFHKEEMVAVATFVRHHRDISLGWVLSRWCGQDGRTISGGLSKISKFALKALKVDRLISWSDNRFSDGSGYLAAGWVLDGDIPPDYFYISTKAGGNFIISKQSRRKSVVHTPEGMTEWEHAKKDGLLRVYDAGKKRWIFK
jgi:hypothetical protein